MCRLHGILTIADAVIVGFGRLGGWLGVERFGLKPDLIVFAKGVTSGYLPLGGVIAAPNIAAPFWTTRSRPASPTARPTRARHLLRSGAREPRPAGARRS